MSLHQRDVVQEARRALAARDHDRAAALLHDALATTQEPRERAALLLELTTAEARRGRIDAAWDACRAASTLGRMLDDATILADSALAAPVRGHGGWAATAEHHALAAEALRTVDDPERRRRLQDLLVVTTDTWTSAAPVVEPTDEASSAAERFGRLRARHEARLHVRFAEERLALAAEAGTLGDEYAAWAALWEAGACAQLGRRLELDAAAMRLRGIAAQLREPSWDWRVGTVLAQQALLDGSLARAADLARDALAAAGTPPPLEAVYIDLILRSQLAVRTGVGLDGIDAQLRVQLVGMPFFAQAWRAGVLLAAGQRAEAEGIWRALRPVITRLPEGPIEWLIVLASFAEITVALEDRESAAVLYELLRPVDGFQVQGDAQTPNGGPVALLLGGLAALLDDRAAARRHLAAAAREADAMYDPHHAAVARAALAGFGASGPLSPRELEVARLVAEGRSNRAIAEHLHLSVRTVENHVAHILTKLGAEARSSIAAWVARRDR